MEVFDPTSPYEKYASLEEAKQLYYFCSIYHYFIDFRPKTSDIRLHLFLNFIFAFSREL